MKKVLLIILLIILNTCICFAHDKKYLSTNSFYIYDIDSFKQIGKTFSIDIIYDIHFKNHKLYRKIKSPHDNNNIQYIIMNVVFNSENKTYTTSYKGYVSGVWILEGMTYLFDDSKFYYEQKADLMKYYNKSAKEFKKYANNSSINHYMDFPKDITKIYEAYKNKSFDNLDGLDETINTY